MTILQEKASIAPSKTGTKYRARLIAPGWGSSGHYSEALLESDGPTAFPANTPVYMDHPGQAEAQDRPERSIRDLAGKITSTPVYESDGLYADIEFYPHAAPIIEALWQDVGMSIRASGTSEAGEADGRRGNIITSLSEGLSVDVVTKAGAGGKIMQLLESARGPLVEATANEKQSRLSDAVRGAHAALDRTYAWVRDYDETFVFFEVETPTATTLYRQGYAEAEDTITLTGAPEKVIATTTYKPLNPAVESAMDRGLCVPLNASIISESSPSSVADETSQPPAGQEKPNKEKEPPMGDTTNTGRVTEAGSEIDKLKAENAALKAEIAALKKGSKKQEAARIYADAFREAGVEAPTLTQALSESAVTDDDLDVAALTEAAKTQAAEIAAAQGAGTPKGLGDTNPITESKVHTPEDIINALEGN